VWLRRSIILSGSSSGGEVVPISPSWDLVHETLKGGAGDGPRLTHPVCGRKAPTPCVWHEGAEVDLPRVRRVGAEEESRSAGLHLSLVWGPDVPSEVSCDKSHFTGGGSNAFPSLLPPSCSICNEFLELVPFQISAANCGIRWSLEEDAYLWFRRRIEVSVGGCCRRRRQRQQRNPTKGVHLKWGDSKWGMEGQHKWHTVG
jgi:hypothetical protein